jgi:hypothetical protein
VKFTVRTPTFPIKSVALKVAVCWPGASPIDVHTGVELLVAWSSLDETTTSKELP